MSFDATETVVDAVFQAIRDELIAGGKVQIHGFGTFKVETRAAHKGRNIRSGEELTIPACKYIRFKQSATLKKIVNA